MSTQNTPISTAEAVAEPVQEVSLYELAGLFASDLEPERLDLAEKFGPAFQGCWVELRAMDADSYARYLSSGQTVQIRQGKLQSPDVVDIQLRQAEQELHLLLHTVTDFHMKRKKRAHTGETVQEEVATAGKTGNSKSRFMEEIFKQLHPLVRAYLVAECQRVNGLVQLGNLIES